MTFTVKEPEKLNELKEKLLHITKEYFAFFPKKMRPNDENCANLVSIVWEDTLKESIGNVEDEIIKRDESLTRDIFLRSTFVLNYCIHIANTHNEAMQTWVRLKN